MYKIIHISVVIVKITESHLLIKIKLQFIKKFEALLSIIIYRYIKFILYISEY